MSKNKSAVGHRPSVTEPPPRASGKPWWTEPPTSAPEPAHIAFAVAFKVELHGRFVAPTTSPSERAQLSSLLHAVKIWIKRANVLAQEFESEKLGLGTTDGLLVEASRLVCALLGRLGGFNAGIKSDWEKAVAQTLQRRAGSILQQRSGRAAVIRRVDAPRRGGG